MGLEEDIRAVAEGLAEDLYSGDPTTFAGVRAAAGDEGGPGTFNTVAVGPANLLVGGMWNSGPADPDAPADGPNPDLDGQSPMMVLLQALALVALAERQATAPTVNDDASKGYSPGKLWIDTTGPTFYGLVTSTVGAAVWVALTGSGGSGTDVQVNGVSTGTTANLNVTTPAAPGDGVNVRWQQSGSGPTSVSANVPVDGTTIINSGGVLAATGGSGPSPSATVVAETSFGQSSNAGVAATYSKGDHTHGTPTAPTASSVGAVDIARTLTGTAPITIAGDNAAHDLSANRTIAVIAATTAAVGVVQLATPSSDVTAGHVVQANDARLSDSRAPTGAAGGGLSGTYPNPSVNASTVDHAGLLGSSLVWTASGHVGTGSVVHLAAFDASNAAAMFTVSGTGTVGLLQQTPTLKTPVQDTYETWTDTSSNAGAAGRLQRNLANLSWHNGTAAKDLVQVGGQIGGTGDSSTILGLRETNGPTLLTYGAITVANPYLGRSGTDVIGFTAQQILDDILTTKGDILGYSTLPVRKGISGNNGAILSEDSVDATNIVWLVYKNPGFGDGSDGNVTYAANTTLGEPVQAANVTINSTVRVGVDGFNIRVLTLLTFTDATSIISHNGVGGIGVTGGSAANNRTIGGGSAGGNGTGSAANGNAGTARANSYPALNGTANASNGGAGGNNGIGNTGGIGAVSTQPSSANNRSVGFSSYESGITFGASATTLLMGGSGGGGGAGNTGCSGGGGGGGAGCCMVWAYAVTGAGIIEANGGTGAAAAGGALGGGGGGGGGGGWALLVYHYGPATLPTVRALGGTGGAKQAGGTNGTDGQPGIAELRLVA